MCLSAQRVSHYGISFLLRLDVTVSIWTDLRRIAAHLADREIKTEMLSTIPTAFRIEVSCDVPKTIKFKHMTAAVHIFC